VGGTPCPDAELSDAELVARIRASEPELLRCIALRYRLEIYGYIYGRGFSAQDAEDIAGDVFLAIVRDFDSYKEDRASIRTWVYGITKHKIYDHQRRAMRQARDPLFVHGFAQVFVADAIEEDLAQLDEWEDLSLAIQELAEDDQKIVRWRSEDVEYSEIAGCLRKSRSAVEKAYQRAIQRLRRALS